ncbi:MAG: hypothetical protein DRN61_05175 [Thaumarchaeota archaeon]|nr:MAG: hypothetical protein DRN61_05175 [Nitrososphaerota archaeon]
MVGQWLGVLVVFGSVGAVETGYYYVAFAIANVILMVATSLTGLLLPVLSGMVDGRKRAAGRVLRLSLAFMVPLAVFIGFYPWLPLGLLGSDYVAAGDVLSVLLLGCVPFALSSCVVSLLYAYGRYNLVLGVGLAQNVPSIILYFLLVPVFGGFGAALSYALGRFAGLAAAVVAGGLVGFLFDFRGLACTVVPPLAAGFACWVLGVHWIIALIVIAVVSVVSYARLGVVGRGDLREIAYALLSKRVADRLGEKMRFILDFLYGG